MPEITEEELKAFKTAADEAKALKSTNERLLDESKSNKTKADEALAKIEKAEEDRLSSEGKIQELFDKEKLKTAELSDKLTKRTKSVLQEKVRTEIAKVAKDAHDIDMVLRVSEHKDLLKINEEELTVTGVEEYVAKVRESHDYLFGKKRMPDAGGGKPPGPGNEDPNAMGDDEKEKAYIAELKTVKSRKEQKEVMVKYGKNVDSFHLM